MPHSLWLAAALITSLLSSPPLANAQDPPPPPASEKGQASESPWLRSGNEFGVWTGYSPFSFKLKGQTEDRKLFLLNLQYARTLFTTRPLTFRYTAEIVPVALEMQPTQGYLVNGNPLINPAATIYGAGASPIGFQGNFGRKSIQPFANGSVGFLYFQQQVPIIGSSQFNYTVTIGFGAQFFRRSGRSFTVGWKYHHLSNDYQAPLNPGIDSSVFYAGFSIFQRRRQ
ncbi:MAG: acyloxyacyl hydrolase [Terriglobales bacterium]